MKVKKKFMSEVDLNKSSNACSPCHQECKKINERINIGVVWVYGTGNAVTLGQESYSSFNSSLVNDISNLDLSDILSPMDDDDHYIMEDDDHFDCVFDE